jgi:hypothetical protein
MSDIKKTAKPENDILLHEKMSNSDIWYVQGKRWNGMVTKEPSLPFKCTCDQYVKYKRCVHITTVKVTLKMK